MAGLPAGLDLEEQEEYLRSLQTHFIPKAQGEEGLASGSNIWYFTGRQRALTDICRWLQTPPPCPKLLVVTGRPGTGKSALVGRLLTLADPKYRGAILAAAQLPPETVPSVRAFDTAIHFARSKSGK